jgi:tripartite-type tricarboxylate transporter receptor subunit TctC
VAPAGTPGAIIEKLNAEITKAITASDTRAQMADIGLEAETSTPGEFGAFLKTEIAKWAKVIKATGLKPDA